MGSEIEASITQSPRNVWTVVDAIVFAIVVAVAAITRLTYLDLVEFRDDEPKAANLAVALLDGRLFPLVGIPSSVGANNPPAFVYLLAIPLAISRDPVAAAGFIGLLGVGAVLLCYRVCDEFFGRRTAQIASLLFASSPTAIVLTRKIQEQDVLPFFVLLLVGSVFSLIAGRGRFHLLGIALWLCLLVQLHFAAIALIPVTLIALTYYWWKVERFQIPWRWVGGAVVLAVVLWLPFTVFQVTHSFTDIRQALAVARGPSEVSVADFQYLVDMASSNAYIEKTGRGAAEYVAETVSFDGLYVAERILFVASIAFVIGRLVWTRGRRPGDWRHGFLLVWLVVPPLVFVHHSTPLYSHYFLTVFPAQFIVMAILLAQGGSWLAARVSPAVPTVAGTALVGSLVLSQVYGLITVMDFIGRASTEGSHGVPLREQELALNQTVALAAGSGKPVYLPFRPESGSLPFEYLAAGRISLKPFDDTNSFVLPPADGSPSMILTTDPDDLSADVLREQFAGYRVTSVPFPGLAKGFDLYQLPTDAGSRLLQRAGFNPLDRAIPNGMRLLGYEVTPVATAGRALRLGVFWRVTALPPPGEEYAFFTHLVDGDGKIYAQRDALDYPPTSWQVGETVVSWFRLDSTTQIPADRGWIDVGVYRRSDTKRLPLLAPAGTSTDHLMLGPVELGSAR